ncbi:MAG: purine-nucleoside phosphorylase [Hyphomicrobiaceae bacterium]
MTAPAGTLKVWLGARRPVVAVVLGSSLGAITEAPAGATRLAYSELPGFPEPGVSGHSGVAIAGQLGGRDVLLLSGRAHAYEHGDAAAMRPVIAAVAAAGIKTLILTNAAGSLDPTVRPGRIVLIADHINLSGMNPLIGETGDERFVSMTDAYDPGLRRRFLDSARRIGLPLAEDVYAWFSGPSFETPAEIRMAQRLGAGLVGMSTAPETILARRFDLKVAALSVVTNLGAGLEDAAPSHAETKAEGSRAAGDLLKLLVAVLEDLDE